MNNIVILLVDDETSILKSLRRTFFEYPYKIIAALTPTEAKEILNSSKVDMIISDYKMPGMSGFELLTWVQNKYPEIIRIMLSGYVDKNSILKSLFTCAALTVFPKPWDDTKLLNRITQLLDIKQSISNSKFWKLINSGNLFEISIYEIDQMCKYRNEVKLNNKIAKLVSENIFLFFRVARMVNSDYFKPDSVFNLEDAVNLIGFDNILTLTENISKTSLAKTDVYLIMPQIFSVYYNSIYKLLSGRKNTEPLNINLPFVYLTNYLLLRTNQEEYLRRVNDFLNKGVSLDSATLVVQVWKLLIKTCRLPDQFLEISEKIEADESYSALAAKKLRDLVELFWWSNRMPEDHPFYTLPLDLLKKIYKDVKKLQP